MTKKNTILSKSKLMKGIQCPKQLWLHVHNPELEPKADGSTQLQYDEGNHIGELARKNFGKGYLVQSKYWEYEAAALETQEAILAGQKTIFEAAFLYKGYYARADILTKTKAGWQIIEVKKSTSAKDEHLKDAGIQTFIIESTGLKVSSIQIMHINNECVFPNLDNLFTQVDITEEIRTQQKGISKELEALSKVVLSKTIPKNSIGPHCDEPFSCPFKDYCWKEIPENSIFDLPALGSKKKWELFESGKIKIKDLKPADFKGNTQRAIESVKKGQLFVDKDMIKAEVKSWNWPLYFFDFETIAPGIPRYNGSSPYTGIPFQFSCHVWESPTKKTLKHFEYLHTEMSDPRPGIIAAMIKGLGTEGSIVAYNMGFEKGVISKLAGFDSKNSKKLLALNERFVDPLPLIRKAVYHPDFAGSFSIKAVGPALLGEAFSYEGMEIGDGGTAQVVADQMLKGLISKGEKEKVIQNLLTYCQKDTLAMVELVRWLYKQK